MLATQPTRGDAGRRAKRDRSKTREDDPHPDRPRASADGRRMTAPAPRVLPGLPHRNHWGRADLMRAFGQDLDTSDPEDILWPARTVCWR
jgi:hypothetical protein